MTEPKDVENGQITEYGFLRIQRSTLYQVEHLFDKLTLMNPMQLRKRLKTMTDLTTQAMAKIHHAQEITSQGQGQGTDSGERQGSEATDSQAGEGSG